MDLKPILYGLASAFTWGAGDFGGGVASRRANAYAVVIWADILAMTLVTTVALTMGESLPSAHDAWLAIASGVLGGLGILLLYQSFTEGKMSVAAPVSALMSGVLPVAVGIFTEGLPALSVMVGLVLALLAIWLVAREEDSSVEFNWSNIRAPLAAGVFFALFFILMNEADGASILWPIVLLRISAIATLAIIARWKNQSLRPPLDIWYLLLYVGVFDLLGNLFFILSSRAGRLDVSSVLASLYPGMTVLLAWLFLREHVSKWQRVGIGCALIAIVLIAI